jgi:diaminohydroxyphosphoribosylaminopyrimidine deaminase / 5-amino-6-(5-phosphoribosylamino)uracil reductase
MEYADESFMRRALELAERGRGYVEPNPLVGAVLVREGRIVGEGWHERFSHAHAEVNALNQAGEAARGAECYVTLEPCCHSGKTPPCTEALIRTGVVRVLAAMEDPFPQVAGQGAARLRAGGIPISFGLCEKEARRQNAPYLKLLKTGLPYIHAKWAMTLDGKIATRSGDSKWISNEASRRLVHELRGRMDAIIIGIGTALADNPLLTARPPGARVPLRVILDSQARLPLASRLVQTASEVPTMLVASTGVAENRLAPLRAAGCQILQVAAGADGKADLQRLLTHLGQMRATNVLVEGGAEVLGSFLDLGAIDETHVFVAPGLIGGTESKTAIAGRGCERVADGMRYIETEVKTVDGDVYVRGWRE